MMAGGGEAPPTPPPPPIPPLDEPLYAISLPRVHVQGGLSVCRRCCCQHENCQLSSSRRCKHNKSVDINEKLVSTCFELLKMAY